MSQASIITLSILLLVGLVAAVAIAVLNYAANNDRRPTTSAKAVQEMCQPTDYKEACFKSLGRINSDDPKELVRAAFESTKDEISEVASKSEVLKELAEDPKTAEAVKDCKELFQDSIDDLQRSFEEIGEFDINKVNIILENIKIWLSATLTYQETCLDGFDNTNGDASERVRKALQTAMQMSSNGLAIVNEMSILLSSLEIPSFNRRRLLTVQRHVVGHDNNNVIHNWLKNRRLLSSTNDNVDSTLLEDDEPDRRRRRLLSSNNRVVGHDDDNEIMPAWLDGRRRQLLESTNLTEDLKAKANVVVAQDGSGKYKTIEQALQDIPKYGNESFIVYIKEGVYNEYLVLYKWMTHLVFVGDGPTKTRITNNKNFADEILYSDIGFVKEIVDWATLARDNASDAWVGFIYALEALYDKESGVKKIKSVYCSSSPTY
ncbi:putative pectinesterase/pectinesterase inhibitor 28 [Silene latifolia]|uniref:putative pectinesterase/pectinesterase inhibitor 28 n=1 Tax=Silene latifolia TaxID=37657 RepID=UPI003D77FF08